MGVVPRVDLKFIVGAFKQTVMAASQRPGFRWTALSAVPVSVFGASYFYNRQSGTPAVEDFEIRSENLCKPEPVEILQRYFSDRQLQKLVLDEGYTTPDFYEVVFTERGMGEQPRGRELIQHRLLMRQRLDALQVYLQFIRECKGLAADSQELIAKDIEQSIQKTKEALDCDYDCV